MEVSQKEQNRSKWRASTKHGRGRGRGTQGGGIRSQTEPDSLESNYDRYIGSDEDDSSKGVDDGLPPRQSQGADLVQLLAEAEQFYAQAHFRYRSFLEAADTEPPLADVATFEQELVIQPELLVQALSALPLPQLLGLSVPAEFLAEGSWDSPPGPCLSTPHASQQQQQQQQPTPPLQPPQRQQPAQSHPDASDQHVAAAAVRPRDSHTATATPAATAPSGSTPAVALPQHRIPAPATAATAAAATGVEDDTDELLELLLSGAPSPQAPAAATAVCPAVPANPSPTQHLHQVSDATAGNALPSQQKLPGPQQQSAAAATGPRAAGRVVAAGAAATPPSKPSAAVFDDELDVLLGLGSSKGQQQAAPSGSASATSTTGATASFEEWLDKF